MNRQLLLIFLACLFLFGCRKHNDDPMAVKLTRTQAERDLKLFSNILKSEHPALYLYISKERVDELLNDANSAVADGITIHDLYNTLANIVNEIGCSHTDIDLPDNVYDSLLNRKYFFPYPVSWIEDKLVVNAVGYTLPEGTEIKKINGLPAKKILEALTLYNPVEGRHRKVQEQLAAERFSNEYFFKYGRQQNFELDIIDTSGLKKIITEQPVTLRESRKRYNSNRYYYDRSDADYDLYFMPKYNCAYLKVSTFAYDERTKQDAFENFCQNSFELLSYKKPKNLIIDIRENTGGKFYNTFLLFSYLAKTGFREYEKVFSKTSHVYYDQYLDPDFAGEEEEKANDALKREFTEHSDKDYYFMADSAIGKWKPDKFHYGGNVYVVTNDKVMSAAAYFATLVQHSGVGKIIGDGTTGGSSSSNGYNTLQYILPESGIKFYFPFAHFIYTYKDQKNNGMGIRPDWIVPDTYESFKENSDHQVSFIVDSLILN